MPVLNFNKPLSPPLASALSNVLMNLAAAGTVADRQALMGQIASDYRNGGLLAGVALPAYTGSAEIDLDSLQLSFDGEALLDAAVRAVRRSPETQVYLQAMSDDLVSPVKGRRFVSACALLGFLLRE